MATTRALAFEPDLDSAVGAAFGTTQLSLVHSDPLVDAFHRQLPLPEACCPVLAAALRHTLAAPGSLIRMRVAFPMAQAFGVPARAALHAATAIEYFHTASLLLDDLPCMDDASERRGAPCVHRVYGDHEAILAALALINRAYALAWKAMAEAEPESAATSADYLEQMLGLSGVLSGQSRDLNPSPYPGMGQATQVARQKTVALIRLALVWPARMGGASQDVLTRLERLAQAWGLAYQAADDLKDLLQSDEASGKTAARDALLHRPNLAIELGIGPAFARLERLLAHGDKVFAHLCRHIPELAFLEQLRSGFHHEYSVLRGLCGRTEAEPLA